MQTKRDVWFRAFAITLTVIEVCKRPMAELTKVVTALASCQIAIARLSFVYQDHGGPYN